MRDVKLTRTEQEKLFQAVVLYERGYWKSHADSVLAVFCEIIDYPRELLKYGKSFEDLRNMEERIHFKTTYLKMKREYLRLKHRKLIVVSEKENRVLTKLSDKGLMRLIKRMLRDHSEHLKDNQKLFVTFDIPESAHHARAAFRHFLKTSNFKMLQKSVWMTDRDVREALILIMKELKINEWVSVIFGGILET